ncbi:uncharacterized protein TOT_030000557 [Theileria orientalis strain Shintoku]|uniref:ATPase AAA-type core domain-containing protein n=1 Tax=Theileria orientalis strain Shintoku TaxID=869250 RepID=J4DPU1_THEOR|nr:uncharacterized protein TOT_030000557 [Theileria orientalis strain Shintoku]PVC49764.1 hypothetical protein MACL_00002780 [Theileria orientalis]BAM41294.1 uncharacterized protein TOT_030000557 [Theileria orientalis strain Shintoku]|eukprot:XP_009691595.1 uncharacterized protein TOT_030000557 [Theileria orientalis strain Shintoku]
MSNLKLDLVFLFASPVISNPLESLHLKLLEALLKHFFSHKTVLNYEIEFLRLRFLSKSQLKTVFETLQNVCKLLNVSMSDLKIKFEDNDLLEPQKSANPKPRVTPNYRTDPKSEFEREMCNIFIPLLKYKRLFDLYGIEGYTNVLLYGSNAGNKFVDWYRSMQSKVNRDDQGNEASKTLQLCLIRFSEILMPYFGESEQKLRFLFELSVEKATEGVLCICLEGLHNFSNSKDTSDDLERRILSTLLILLDGINRKKPATGVSVVVVATTEQDPALLDESLLRPGRLERILEIVN